MAFPAYLTTPGSDFVLVTQSYTNPKYDINYDMFGLLRYSTEKQDIIGGSRGEGRPGGGGRAFVLRGFLFLSLKIPTDLP